MNCLVWIVGLASKNISKIGAEYRLSSLEETGNDSAAGILILV